MIDLDNPLGLDGFEFVEFSAPEKGLLEPVFTAMGFTMIARHRSKDVQLWRQGGINLIAIMNRAARPLTSPLNMARPPAAWAGA
jgi:4-hydroxyphenylpyruvate dioxygenase-like putative hemolysin